MAGRTLLDHFIDSHYFACPGDYVLWAEFAREFRAYCEFRGAKYWSDDKIIRYLGSFTHPVGLGPHNKRVVGNLSRYKQPRRYVLKGKRVRLQRDDER